ncbi:MAG: type II toxin-antitoxin system RelE/ParE family toxin [Anaerolineae bacterium]
MSDPYRLELSENAEESLRKLDKTVLQRIIRKLRWLAQNADTIAHTALKGEWSGFFRLRIGDYRVIYRLDSEGQIIVVELVGHRREIYDD